MDTEKLYVYLRALALLLAWYTYISFQMYAQQKELINTQ